MATVIAEIGSNHQQNMQCAKDSILAAQKAGANIVKFQTFSKELYASRLPDNLKNIPDILRELELPRDWHRPLKDYCDEQGIEFLSTPFDETAIDLLVKLGVKRLKVAAFESGDPRFLKLVASTKLPLLISVNNFDQLIAAELVILSVNPNAKITFLHCNSAYPSPIKDAYLKQISQYLAAGKQVGFSDHSEGILLPPIAVALGATVIEKHFTLNKKLPGADHAMSLEPSEFKQMVLNIKSAEAASQYKLNQFSESEHTTIFGRRSIVTKIKVKKGDLLTEENVTTKRPKLPNSVPDSLYPIVLGEYLFANDLDEGTILCWSDIFNKVD